MNRYTFVVLMFGLFVLAILAGAGPTNLPGMESIGLTRAGLSGKCNYHIFTSASSTEDFPAEAAGSTPAFFECGAPIQAEVSGGQGALFFTADSGATIGAQGASATASEITGAGGTDQGHGHMFFDGGRETLVLNAVDAALMGAANPSGICDGSVTGWTTGTACYPLCEADADCVAWSAGTSCRAITSTDYWATYGCMPLHGRFDTDNTAVIVCHKP